MEIVRYHHCQPVEDFIDAILGSMERLRDAVSRIGEEELVNCVLVQEGEDHDEFKAALEWFNQDCIQYRINWSY